MQQTQLKEATENLAWMQDELQVYNMQNRQVEALRRRQYEEVMVLNSPEPGTEAMA